MKNKFLIIVSTFLIVCSCNRKVQSEKNTGPNGIWEQIGYGRIIELNDTTLKLYDITKQNCKLSDEIEILNFGKIKNYTKDT
ncbi:MAG: hypothetical protein KJN68_08425, partial [Bacteroidia bacterium]|nr:hypothetical protein [Bacteroidia bacterium]